MTKKRLAIVGDGGHGKVVADSARLMGLWDDIVFFDDKHGPQRSFTALTRLASAEFDVFVAIGRNSVREKLFQSLDEAGFVIPVIKHPGSIIAVDSKIGAGTALFAGVIVNPGARVGNGVVINTAASIDHDCQLDDFVHIAPGARLAGTVVVGARTWVGVGAVVCENRSIGKDVMIAAGAVVVGDVANNITVKGVPAK